MDVSFNVLGPFLPVIFTGYALESGQENIRNSGYPYFVELPDSLPPLHDVIVYISSDPELSGKIMETYLEMDPESRGALYPDGLVKMVLGSYLYNRAEYSRSVEVHRELLDDPYVTGSDSLHMNVLDKLMEGSRMINDFDNTMQYAIQMLEIAKRADDKSQIGRAYLFMGKTQFRIGDKQDALRYFSLAQENMEAGNNAHWLSHLYLTLANLFMEYEEYQKSYDYAILYEKSLDQLAQSYDAKNQLFIETHKGRAYVMLAEVSYKLGREKEADRYYEKFKNTWNATDPAEGYFILRYLMAAGRYREAEPYVLRKQENLWQGGDTLSNNMLNVKHFLQHINNNLGNKEKAYDYAVQRITILSELRKKENESSALEITAAYETAEREAIISAQQEQIRIRNTYIVVAFIIAAFLMVLLVSIIIYNRKLDRKNRLLVEGINRQLKGESAGRPFSHNSQGEGRQLDNNGLFADIERLMQSEKLYLNKGLLRDDVVNRLGTNKNYLIDAIKENTGMNFTDYLNHLRLEYSLTLLSSTGDIISQVAASSGFGSVSSYHRLFTEKYGISPNVYRKLSKQNEKLL
ncbi:MAG: AraC family transcriptional regulator [Alistipes sp.]|nr:AraC family transcriptional regulator [Alistipes sp.]